MPELPDSVLHLAMSLLGGFHYTNITFKGTTMDGTVLAGPDIREQFGCGFKN